MRNFFFAILALTLSTGGFAQDKASTAPGPAHFARMRAQVYAKALGLDESQQQKMIEIYTVAETEVADLRAACREAQLGVESAMKASDAEAEGVLTKAQRAALMELRMKGDFDTEVPSCIPATGSCVHSAACCAGAAKSAKGTGVITEQRVLELEAPK